jgi:hypothetical protein
MDRLVPSFSSLIIFTFHPVVDLALARAVVQVVPDAFCR